MRTLFAVPIFFLSALTVGWSAEPEAVPHLDLNDPGALQEAIRLLDEEVKLAARPHTYVVIDLVANTVLIKGRGIELHRFPVDNWSASHLGDVTTTFRLRERPPVSRRKIDPAGGTEQSPISLDDMPTDFTLEFTPSLTITVQASAPGHPWRWLAFKGREWWTWLKGWGLILATGYPPSSAPALRLTVAQDHAQSLAWAVTDGMPFLVRRTAPPSPESGP